MNAFYAMHPITRQSNAQFKIRVEDKCVRYSIDWGKCYHDFNKYLDVNKKKRIDLLRKQSVFSVCDPSFAYVLWDKLVIYTIFQVIGTKLAHASLDDQILGFGSTKTTDPQPGMLIVVAVSNN